MSEKQATNLFCVLLIACCITTLVWFGTRKHFQGQTEGVVISRDIQGPFPQHPYWFTIAIRFSGSEKYGFINLSEPEAEKYRPGTKVWVRYKGDEPFNECVIEHFSLSKAGT